MKEYGVLQPRPALLGPAADGRDDRRSFKGAGGSQPLSSRRRAWCTLCTLGLSPWYDRTRISVPAYIGFAACTWGGSYLHCQKPTIHPQVQCSGGVLRLDADLLQSELKVHVLPQKFKYYHLMLNTEKGPEGIKEQHACYANKQACIHTHTHTHT